MDAGLMIKELAALVGVTEDTVINWEVRGMKPTSKNIERIDAALTRLKARKDRVANFHAFHAQPI